MNKVWKVIKIIDDYRIVINGGKNDLLKREDELEVFVEGENVIDPDTKESLGTLDIIKARLVVVDAFDRMAVCKNAETYMQNALNPLSQFQIYKHDRLKVDPAEITGPVSNIDKTIRIGDLVRKA
ncbi:hypothetical protein [Sporanaerobacter acetigenes]|uniref:hypothetical protein n=1 Tax=Sporanaerobacter acetigenes TaxID=165813 RepID=UPI001044FF5F|nr:hypothetical protein [Sporanaerobacter acetigenes]